MFVRRFICSCNVCNSRCRKIFWVIARPFESSPRSSGFFEVSLLQDLSRHTIFYVGRFFASSAMSRKGLVWKSKPDFVRMQSWRYTCNCTQSFSSMNTVVLEEKKVAVTKKRNVLESLGRWDRIGGETSYKGRSSWSMHQEKGLGRGRTRNKDFRVGWGEKVGMG